MVARRFSRRRRFRRRRPLRRRSYRRRRVFRRSRRQRVHSFTRWTDVASQAILDNGSNSTMTFALSQLPSYTEFTNLFDQYKINCVVLKMRFLNQIPDRVDSSTGVGRANFHYCIDYNDSVGYTTVSQFAQVSNYRVHALNGERDWSIKIFPKCQKQIYVGLASTGYGPTKSWINTADAAVPHYGLKYLIESGVAGVGENTIGILQIQAKYYISCKNVK